MALIAKENLYIGFTLAARPGNVVSPDAAKEYGWQDKVEDDGKGDVGGDAEGTASKKRPTKS